MTDFFRGARVLVTGGTGLIGRPLVERLIAAGASVRVVSLDDASRAHPRAEFRRCDLAGFDACMSACEGMDFVFHLAGIKGSPAMTAAKPASFFVPTILFNTNVLEAARRSRVARLLYTSTIGVYAPAEVFREDDVWRTFPSPNDRFAGWAKRMGELQVEAYAIEYGWKDIAIVRPANVYGPWDNFDPRNAMVIPSLVARALDGEDPLVVWGDGSQIRDFVYADDVAEGMMMATERLPPGPVNLGSGEGVSVRRIVEIIAGTMKNPPRVEWDRTKPPGDRRRVMDVSRARSMGFECRVPIEEGIRRTMDWYARNKGIVDRRYNVFAQGLPSGEALRGEPRS